VQEKAKSQTTCRNIRILTILLSSLDNCFI
jgi:hypothetical protein